MTVNWTTTPPAEPGWYWQRVMPNASLRTPPPPRAVKVFEFESELGISNQFMDKGFLALRLSQSEWWPERIQEPEDEQKVSPYTITTT